MTISCVLMSPVPATHSSFFLLSFRMHTPGLVDQHTALELSRSFPRSPQLRSDGSSSMSLWVINRHPTLLSLSLSLRLSLAIIAFFHPLRPKTFAILALPQTKRTTVSELARVAQVHKWLTSSLSLLFTLVYPESFPVLLSL
ncbi:hypothetical protein R1flu_014014 [Riccia fluitans]|uniref:Uncharacterized protein n=1 Tax=Riccia fluitans TaxID=41844 RepID=A0ABD1YEW9_9MARC